MPQSKVAIMGICRRWRFMLPISIVQSRASCRRGKRLKNIRRFSADAGYRKTFEQDIFGELGLSVDISARIKPEWKAFPKRWIVERSLAWFNNFRRLSKNLYR